MLLDLDSRETWHLDFESLVYSQEVWPTILAKLDAGDMQRIEFLSQVTCAEDHLHDDLARFLQHKGREILSSKYSHVVGYHGCRPKDRASYLEKGILPSNPDVLIIEARSLYAGIDGFEETLSDIGSAYLTYNAGKVGLLMSAVRAKRDRNQYANGSELMRGFASRLGREAKTRLVRMGMPTLIKCAIPVNWLDSHTAFPVGGSYANHVLEELICRKRWPDDEFTGCSGWYYLTRAVPPEKIIEFIDMTDFSDQDHWLQE